MERRGTTHEHRGNGIRNLKFLAPILILALLAASCAPKVESIASTTVWRDPGLGTPDIGGLSGVMFELDFSHQPAGSYGSVGMEASYDYPGKSRIVSEEVSPNPGYLVDKTFEHGVGEYSVWPVSPINPGDEEIVYVANSKANSSDKGDLSNAREYVITRAETGNELKIKYLGHKLIDPPGTYEMRDALVSPEAQLQQEINVYTRQQQENMITTLPRDSGLVGGTWVSPKEPVTSVGTNGTVDISAIPTSKFPIQKVVFTADFPGRKSPDPTNPDGWAFLGFAYKPNKDGVWRLPPFDVTSLRLKTGDKITIGFDVVAMGPDGKLVRKLSPNGTHVLAITN